MENFYVSLEWEEGVKKPSICIRIDSMVISKRDHLANH